jgi:mono/diheme cytochrome c family protein
VRFVLAAAALFAAIQLVPYGRDHANPTASVEPRWDSTRTRDLARSACFDCHSNLTTWPWYSNVAPVSWLVANDVRGGRGELNFSAWNRAQEGADGTIEALVGGSMPPWYYTVMHPQAKLSGAEKAALERGLRATFRRSPPQGRGG